MTLPLATLLSGLFLTVLGGLFVWNGDSFKRVAMASLRSRALAGALLTVATVWFLSKVLNWSEVDFGRFRNIFFVVFLFVAIGSWIYVKDFLAVRAGAALTLLCSEALLAAAWMRWEHPQRLLMVTAVYLFIILALYWGTLPFKARDFLEWIQRVPLRARLLGVIGLAWGLALCATAATY